MKALKNLDFALIFPDENVVAFRDLFENTIYNGRVLSFVSVVLKVTDIKCCFILCGF